MYTIRNETGKELYKGKITIQVLKRIDAYCAKSRYRVDVFLGDRTFLFSRKGNHERKNLSAHQ